MTSNISRCRKTLDHIFRREALPILPHSKSNPPAVLDSTTNNACHHTVPSLYVLDANVDVPSNQRTTLAEMSTISASSRIGGSDHWSRSRLSWLLPREMPIGSTAERTKVQKRQFLRRFKRRNSKIPSHSLRESTIFSAKMTLRNGGNL